MIFLHKPADPFDAVDPEYELRTDDYKATCLSIQDARSYGGGFVVNEYGPNPEEIEWSQQVGVCRTLKAAKELALSHYGKRLA
jgi:hypothetical protein